MAIVAAVPARVLSFLSPIERRRPAPIVAVPGGTEAVALCWPAAALPDVSTATVTGTHAGGSFDVESVGDTRAVIVPMGSSLNTRFSNEARNFVKNLFPYYAVATSNRALQRMAGTFIYLDFNMRIVYRPESLFALGGGHIGVVCAQQDQGVERNFAPVRQRIIIHDQVEQLWLNDVADIG